MYRIRAVYGPGISERAGGTSKWYHGDALGGTRGIVHTQRRRRREGKGRCGTLTKRRAGSYRGNGGTDRVKNDFCSHCGSRFAANQVWPRECAACGNITYLNPLPVAVGVVEIDGGLLVIRRTVEPGTGSLALPGGFMNIGETWQEGCVREVYEETGLQLLAEDVRLYDVLTAPNGFVLIFGAVSPRSSVDLSTFAVNTETSEMLIVREPVELAFPLHNEVMQRYFGGAPSRPPSTVASP